MNVALLSFNHPIPDVYQTVAKAIELGVCAISGRAGAYHRLWLIGTLLLWQWNRQDPVII